NAASICIAVTPSGSEKCHSKDECAEECTAKPEVKTLGASTSKPIWGSQPSTPTVSVALGVSAEGKTPLKRKHSATPQHSSTEKSRNIEPENEGYQNNSGSKAETTNRNTDPNEHINYLAAGTCVSNQSNKKKRK